MTCPVLTAGDANGLMKPCIGSLCAWWNEHHNACAVQVGAGMANLILLEMRKGN